MVRIGFIFPSSEYLHDPFRGDPHTHFQILTVLEWYFGNDVKAELIDLRGIKKEFAIYHIPECDIYLHSIYTLDYSEEVSLVNELHKKYPKAIHIAGGPHATVFKEESLKLFDSLILGDGENSIIKAVNDYKSNQLKKIYEQKKPVDINQFPFPKRHFLPKTAIARKGLMTLKNKKGYDELLATTVIFSRGCPYQCTFCVIPDVRKYCPGIRFRKPEQVKEEIEYLKKDYSLEGLAIIDEIGIPLTKNEAVSHLEAIKSTGLVWRGQCRVDGVTPEIAKLARSSGCITMCLGVESVWQPSLDMINKRINIERAKESIKILKQNGIECRIYMILGLPAEPEDIVERSWKFIEETDPDLVYLSILTIRPGTEIYNNYQKYGIKKFDNNWDKTMHMYGRYTNEAPNLSFEYNETNPWGKSFSKEEIINNYLELQKRIKAKNIGTI